MGVEVHFPAVLYADALSLFIRRRGGLGGGGMRDGIGGLILGRRRGRRFSGRGVAFVRHCASLFDVKR